MNDDWHEETHERLTKSAIFNILETKCNNKQEGPAGAHVLSLIDEATFYAYHRTKTVLRHMGEFTLHDGEHLFRVLRLMEKLMRRETIEALSVPSLMLLILAAFFHDIGMAPSEDQVIAWKKFWDISPDIDSKEIEEYHKFERYCSARPEEIEQIELLKKNGKDTNADTMKSYLIADYIRTTHAMRAKEIIQLDWDGKIKYEDSDLTVELAEICFSHNEDTLSLLELDMNHLCGPDMVVCFPLIGVMLRLADLLDFDAKRTPSILFSHLSVRHPVSIQEWNRHRAIEAWSISDQLISFQAKCTHPAIEASIHSFCDLIDKELSSCNNVISAINDYNKLNNRDIYLKLPFKVSRDKIETKRDVWGERLYIYKTTQFSMSKNQVVELLMGTKLYGDPEVALRELLQNSIDACLLRDALEKKWNNSYSPEITVRYYPENGEDILEVTDNGTGMDQYVIDNYYSQIGSSFYVSSDFYDMKADANAQFIPTSRFGIGILSCFMVADTLIVDTRRVYGPHSSSEPINLTVEGQESIFWTKRGDRAVPGTSTKLILRKNRNPWEKMTEDQFIKSVENVVPNPPFKISISTSSHKEVRDKDSFNKITADSLKDYNWGKHENVKEIEISINNGAKGIVGSAIVAILEKHGKPVENIEMTSKEVVIDEGTYTLGKTVTLCNNEVCLSSTSITIDDDDGIVESQSNTYLAKSKSRISLHGIDVPTSLFPDPWRIQKNQVRLSWPFPVLLIVDVCGNRDLDLNTSRTQIVMSDKWIAFEEDLAFTICSGVAERVTKEYWNDLKELLLRNAKSENFVRGLERVYI